MQLTLNKIQYTIQYTTYQIKAHIFERDNAKKNIYLSESHGILGVSKGDFLEEIVLKTINRRRVRGLNRIYNISHFIGQNMFNMLIQHFLLRSGIVASHIQ